MIGYEEFIMSAETKATPHNFSFTCSDYENCLEKNFGKCPKKYYVVNEIMSGDEYDWCVPLINRAHYSTSQLFDRSVPEIRAKLMALGKIDLLDGEKS